MKNVKKIAEEILVDKLLKEAEKNIRKVKIKFRPKQSEHKAFTVLVDGIEIGYWEETREPNIVNNLVSGYTKSGRWYKDDKGLEKLYQTKNHKFEMSKYFKRKPKANEIIEELNKGSEKARLDIEFKK